MLCRLPVGAWWQWFLPPEGEIAPGRPAYPTIPGGKILKEPAVWPVVRSLLAILEREGPRRIRKNRHQNRVKSGARFDAESASKS